MKISLTPMTRELCHTLFRSWRADPAICENPDDFHEYVYGKELCDRYYDRINTSDRRVFAVMKDGAPIGEVQLKRIDAEKGEATLSIHMQNDSVKNKGCGTQAIRLALNMAFSQLGLRTVYADVLKTNARSLHVLDKVGFVRTGEDERFVYFRADSFSGTQGPKEG